MFCLSVSYAWLLLFLTIHDLHPAIQSQRHLSHQRQSLHLESMLLTALSLHKGKRVTDQHSIFAPKAVVFSQDFSHELNKSTKNLVKFSFISL